MGQPDLIRLPNSDTIRPPLFFDIVVIKYGQGGRVDEHKQRFDDYRRTKTKVEVRGPGLHELGLPFRRSKQKEGGIDCSAECNGSRRATS